MPIGGWDRDNVKVKGVDGSDDYEIAAIQDGSIRRLAVDAKVNNATFSPGMFRVSKKMRYVDMNASSGGVARLTTVVDGAAAIDVFSYSGSGIFFGFLLNLESASTSSQTWHIYLQIDGEDIFGSNGFLSTDMISSDVYDFNPAGSREPPVLGMEMGGDVITFSTTALAPIEYASSVKVKVKKNGGGSKKFRAGLVLLTKET